MSTPTMPDVYRSLDDGNRQLMLNVLADIEGEGNDKRVGDLRALVMELDGKIEAVNGQRRRWQRLVDDAQMLIERLRGKGDDRLVRALRGTLIDRIGEYVGLLASVVVDRQLAKKARIQRRIDAIMNRRAFASRMMIDLQAIDGRKVTVKTVANAAEPVAAVVGEDGE